MTTLLLATRNAHKIQEIRALLGEAFVYLTLNDFPGAPAVREDALTFAGNATKKAVQLAEWLSQAPSSAFRPAGPALHGLGEGGSDAFVLADDSGLEVDALNGAPGVHSARFAALDAATAGNATDAANNQRLLRLLKSVPAEQRTARFRCVIALTPVRDIVAENLSSVGSAMADCSPVWQVNAFELQPGLFEGACEGRIGLEPRGGGGFGYDPLFIPCGFDVSFAELGDSVKNQLSHRAKALAKVREHLRRLSG